MKHVSLQGEGLLPEDLLYSISVSITVRFTTEADGKKNSYISVFIKHFVIKTVTYFTVKLEMYWTNMHHEFVMKERPHNFTFLKYFGKFLSISTNL